MTVPGASDVDDPGIVFTTSIRVTDVDHDDPRTQAESMLPWRRKSLVEGGESNKSKGPLKQDEFPSWIENRDYVTSYASPTHTLLKRIDNNTSKPRIHEIFTINESSIPSDSRASSVATSGNNSEQAQGSPVSMARVNMAFLDDENDKENDDKANNTKVYRL